MLVEVGPRGDIQGLGDVDLYPFDVMAIPGASEQPVGESQHVDVLGRLFSEEVVDAIDLLLFEHGVGGRVQALKGLHRRAERLLVDHPGAFGQSVGADPLGEGDEGSGRYRQIVHPSW